MKSKEPAEKVVRYIRRRARRQYSSEEKIRIVLEGLRGEESVASLCRREGISDGLYSSWSKEFLGEAQAPLVRAKRRTARNDWRVTPSARRQVMR